MDASVQKHCGYVYISTIQLQYSYNTVQYSYSTVTVQLQYSYSTVTVQYSYSTVQLQYSYSIVTVQLQSVFSDCICTYQHMVCADETCLAYLFVDLLIKARLHWEALDALWDQDATAGWVTWVEDTCGISPLGGGAFVDNCVGVVQDVSNHKPGHDSVDTLVTGSDDSTVTLLKEASITPQLFKEVLWALKASVVWSGGTRSNNLEVSGPLRVHSILDVSQTTDWSIRQTLDETTLSASNIHSVWAGIKNISLAVLSSQSNTFAIDDELILDSGDQVIRWTSVALIDTDPHTGWAGQVGRTQRGGSNILTSGGSEEGTIDPLGVGVATVSGEAESSLEHGTITTVNKEDVLVTVELKDEHSTSGHSVQTKLGSGSANAAGNLGIVIDNDDVILRDSLVAQSLLEVFLRGNRVVANWNIGIAKVFTVIELNRFVGAATSCVLQVVCLTGVGGGGKVGAAQLDQLLVVVRESVLGPEWNSGEDNLLIRISVKHALQLAWLDDPWVGEVGVELVLTLRVTWISTWGWSGWRGTVDRDALADILIDVCVLWGTWAARLWGDLV